VINVFHVSFQYDHNLILDNVSFQLQEGDFCAFLGPNGSGKTTLFSLLTRLLKIKDGGITFHGKNINSFETKELARTVAFVPQKEDLIYNFTVFEIVMMGRNPYQKKWEFYNASDVKIVLNALEKTNLIKLKERMTHQLSGGELQRVLIARAIAQQTPVIFLDEPLANLDIAHKYEIMEILTHLNRNEKTTIAISLHDFGFACQYAPLSLLIKEGQVQFFGKTKQLATDPLLLSVLNLDNQFHIDNYGNINKINR